MDKNVSALAALTVLVVIAGCAAVPASKVDALDARLAWPCDRLVLTWAVDSTRLRELVGVNLLYRSEHGVGQLHLNVVRCEPPTSRKDEIPLLFAYVSVPVTAGSVPVIVTSVPADGWFAMPFMFGDDDASALFGRMGYELLPASITFVVSASNSNLAINIEITLDGGQFSVVARTSGQSAPYGVSKALLVSASDYLSAFFGQETAERYTSVVEAVRIAGETPLSELGVSKQPDMSVFDRGLESDRVFWKLPVSQQ